VHFVLRLAVCVAVSVVLCVAVCVTVSVVMCVAVCLAGGVFWRAILYHKLVTFSNKYSFSLSLSFFLSLYCRECPYNGVLCNDICQT